MQKAVVLRRKLSLVPAPDVGVGTPFRACVTGSDRTGSPLCNDVWTSPGLLTVCCAQIITCSLIQACRCIEARAYNILL